jgi:hypothetical protein
MPPDGDFGQRYVPGVARIRQSIDVKALTDTADNHDEPGINAPEAEALHEGR